MTANGSTCSLAESCLLQTCEFGETSCFWTVDENVCKNCLFRRYLLNGKRFLKGGLVHNRILHECGKDNESGQCQVQTNRY